MAVQEASFLRNKAYLAASTSHFFIDVLNSGRTLLVAVLAVSLGLSNTQLGLLLLVYNIGSSLSQPLFGWLADRFGARKLVLGGVGWTTFFYGLAAVIPEWPALLAITVASLGSGAFHPGGTKVASETSISRRTQATAVFFMAGQLGLFAGPVLAGNLLDAFDRLGYLFLPLVSFVALLGGSRWLVDEIHDHRLLPQPTGLQHNTSRAPHIVGHTVVLLTFIVIAYNVVSYSAQNFAPKLFTEWGYSASYVGWIAGLFMMGAAVGGVTGGSLADRIGGKPIIVLSMLGMVAPLYLYIPASDLWRLPILFVAGFFAGMPHSIVVLLAQSLLPGRRAFASGLTLGFMFFTGAIGTSVVGVIADRTALDLTLRGTAILPLAAGLAAVFLPRRLVRDEANQ